ncbi:transporter substrate-binding domain-containing protein [Aneurinibacillus aneurinilyticus]|nr:transporter substrate-binding domain-containing protein [Aneurinibacillus aneurinilyticus]MED0705416.1 transporter substrate-binding domain-containing protein [Aneurinibacillus aneurinilyticus]MED0724965.1 transporter substrate-binding domain-containing protein [Aneurinibacillus aneurinilyticus]MED0731013.1 transporter substrate-binding domain-containing protein [Aneurinibacillus aneurinilyticus]MED0742700.1 transporter substrate-binding domain-containing protein [Aneurinibacillus aneurinily
MTTRTIFRMGLALCFFFSFLLFPSTVYQETKNVIRIAGDNQFPPFEYLSDAGVYSGFNIDIMNAVSIQTGTNIEYYPMPWNQAVQALQSGQVDAIQGMKKTEARKGTYEFSVPYFTSSQAIFVLKDNMFIRKVDDLEGRRVAVQKGDVATDLLSRVKQVQLIEADNQQEAIQLLTEEKVDAFVGNRITGQYFLQKSRQQPLTKIVGEPLDATDYGVAVMPKNKELLSVFNKGISRIKGDGTYQKIEKKWFGEYIMPYSFSLRQTLLYLEIGLALTFVIITCVLWWNRSLKKEVGRRTKQIERINKELEKKMVLLEGNVHFQQQLLNSAYSSFITMGPSGNISMMNDRAVEYLHLEKAIIGTSFVQTPLAAFIPEQEILAALQDKKVFLQKETVWIKDRSEKRNIVYSISPIQTMEGDSAGVVLNIMDITEQKELERKIAQEDRLRSLGQLIAGIAHEIRNPLMSILTYTQLLPKKFDSPEFRIFFSRHVTSEITRLNALINDLLDYSRPKKSDPIVFPFYEMAQGIVHLFKQKVKEADVVIRWEFDGEVWAIADVQQIKQVLMNVILNAIEAVEKGGIIIIRGYYEEAKAVLQVEDNGRGMSEEEIHKMFEPFYSKKLNGVGLGLSVTYQLIQENNGEIRASSREGEGTVMTIWLPGCRKDENDVSCHGN